MSVFAFHDSLMTIRIHVFINKVMNVRAMAVTRTTPQPFFIKVATGRMCLLHNQGNTKLIL